MSYRISSRFSEIFHREVPEEEAPSVVEDPKPKGAPPPDDSGETTLRHTTFTTFRTLHKQRQPSDKEMQAHYDRLMYAAMDRIGQQLAKRGEKKL